MSDMSKRELTKLRAAYRLMRLIRDLDAKNLRTERPLGYGRGTDVYAWKLEQDLGPKIASLAFDVNERRAHGRLLHEMEDAGMVRPGRAAGLNFTHVRLTDAGKAFLADLERTISASKDAG